MKNKKLVKNTKGKTFQEVQENNKENADNISNPGYDDIRMQGTISSAISSAISSLRRKTIKRIR